MFKRFKDLIGTPDEQQQQQQQHSPSHPQPQHTHNLNTSFSNTSTPVSSPYKSNNNNHQQDESTSSPKSPTITSNVTSTTATTTNTTTESQIKPNVWKIMIGSDVELVKSQATPQKLKLLWQEFLSSKSDKDKVSRLNKVLPYFISLYEDRKVDVKGGMVDIFGTNSKPFSFAVSRRLVKDINEIIKQSQQPIAGSSSGSSNAHSKEIAGKEIFKFFSTTSGLISGFELLYSIEILSESSTSCEAMSEASIPSVLVRCLQLFFQVPYSTLESLQGIIEEKLIKTLCSLSKQKSAIEELQKTDTLSILFQLMSHECQSTHRGLRAKIGSFGHELSDLHPPTITYINSKKVIGTIINDLNNYYMFTPETYVSLCKIIIKILGESSKKSTILLDEFFKNDGYNFLVESLFRLESSKDKPLLFENLLDSICSLIYVGYGNITIPDSSPVPYQSSIHNLKEISNQNYISKNSNAFKVLESYFLKSTYEENRVKILDRILSVYSSNTANFILLQHTNTLTKFIQDYETLSNPLKYHVMKIVCFVVTVLSCVPFQELSTFSLLVGENPSKYTLDMIYQLITTLVNFEFRYKHIFRETGLLDILVKVIDVISQDIIRLQNGNGKSTSTTSTNEQLMDLNDESLSSIIQVESFEILLDSLYILVSEHPDNIALVRSFSLFNILLTFLPFSSVRGKSLRILLQLIKYDPEPTQREFDGLIKVLTSVNRENYPMKSDILNSIRKLFNISKHARESFREHGGFVSIISVFISLESSFSADRKDTRNWDMEKLELIEAIARCTTSALCGNPVNRDNFEQQIGYHTFSTCLIMTGVLATEWSKSVVDFIFDMVTENLNASDQLSNQMIINNIESFNVVLDIIPHIENADFRLQIISRINKMAEYGRYNQEALSKLSIPDWILQKFPSNLSNANDPLQPLLLSLIQTVGANCLSGSELRQFIKLLQPEQSPEVLLKILSSMAKSSPMPPYFEFNLSKVPFGYVRVPITDRSWPPTNGYTIMFWLYIDKFGSGTAASQQPIDLVHIYSDDKKSSLYIYLKNGMINVNIVNSSKYVIEIPAFKFEESKWYHIGIVHARRLLGGTDFRLFVDGFLKYTASKAQYPAQVSSSSSTVLYCDIGVANQNRFPTDQIWRIGPFYLLEDALGAKHINTIYFLGPNYASNFKGRFSPYQTYEIVNSANLLAIKDLEYGDQLGPLNLAKVSMQIDENKIVVGLNASNKLIRTNNSQKVVYNEIYNSIINELSQNHGVSTNLFSSPQINGVGGSGIGNSPMMTSLNSSSSSASSTGGKKDALEGRIEIINQADLTTKQRGVLVGSVEAFRRNKVADSIKKIGGMPISLLLLEKAHSKQTLFDSLGLLVGLIQYHPTNTHEMSQINGYELLSWVLKKKAIDGLFNQDIVELLFDLIGINGNTTIAINRNEGTVANWNACKNVMMNWEIWKLTEPSLQRHVINGYNSLIVNNVQKKFNIDSLRKVNIIQEIFDILSSGCDVDDFQPLSEGVASSVINVLFNILSHGGLIEDDIRSISAYLISHLHKDLTGNGLTSAGRRKSSYRSKLATLEIGSTANIQLVNQVFYTFLRVVSNCATQETVAIFKRVSPYWCFFFIDENLPPLTVSLALRVTVIFFLYKYDYCSSFIKKSGFKILEKVLPSLSGYQEIYICLLHLLLAGDPKLLVDIELSSSTNGGGSVVFHELLRLFTPFEKNLYCIEAAQLILSLIKRSYEDNYQYLEQQQLLNQQQQLQSQQSSQSSTENDELLSSLLASSNISSSSGNSNTSPLSTPQSLSPSMSSSSISSLNSSNNNSTTSTTTTSSTGGVHGFTSKVGNLWNKFEEKTMEFVVSTGAIEDQSDGQPGSRKSRRLSVSFQQKTSTSTTGSGNNNNENEDNSSSVNNNEPCPIQQESEQCLPELKLSQFATPEESSNLQHTMLTYFIYLFHENQLFQQECYNQSMVEELISILFPNGKLNLPPLLNHTTGQTNGIKDRVLDLVVKFLCQIMLSAMRKTSKAISIIEMVLEGSPTNIHDDEFILYHSRILIELMYVVETNITKTEFFDNERVHSNLIKLSSMLVDRVNLDQLVKSNKIIIAKRVFLFIVKVLEKLEADRHGLKTVQPLYKSLNRIILFLVGHTSDTDLSFVANHIINHQRIIFSENNLDSDFVFALSYPLFKLLISDQSESVENSIKLWKLLLSLKSSSYIEYVASVLQLKVASQSNPRQSELIDLKPGFELLSSSKSGGNNNNTDFKQWINDNITTLTQVFEENPKKCHLQSKNSEKKQSSEHTLPSLKARRNERLSKKQRQDRKDQSHLEEKYKHITKKAQYFVRTEGDRRKKIRQLENDKQKFNAIQWENMRAQITRERAVWGPSEPHPLDKWKLDSTEGPYRMRKKLEKNYNFYKNYPYVPLSFDEQNSSLLPIPCSADSEKYMNIVGTDEENKLEPSYWKFDLLSTNQVITSSTNNIPVIKPANSNNVKSTTSSNNTTTTTTSTNSITSPNNNNETTPPLSPVYSSSEDAILKSPVLQSSISSSTTSSITDSKDEINLTRNPSSSDLFNDNSSSVSDDTLNTSTTPIISSSNSSVNTNQQQPPSTNSSTSSTNNNNQQTQSEIVDEETLPSTNQSNSEDETQAFIRLLDPYDQAYLKEAMRKDARLNGIMYNCGSVDGMDKIEGILIFCPVYMYIFDGYSKDENTGDISEVEEKINSEWLPEGTVLPSKKKIIHYFLKWAYEDIRDVLKRRYLLRQVALEIFSTDGRNNLIVYRDEVTRDEVYHTLVSNVSSHNTIGGDAQSITGGQTGDDNDDQYHAGGASSSTSTGRGMKDRFTSIWRKSPLTLKWQQGQISNFQYLMHLNTLAGRSYNDLTQYPVFPWVLSDYESEELDIDDPRVYRDLSKPMGALQESRAMKFRERFENWDDQEPNEHGHKVPKFHYGTHYSSAAIVLYYLIRLEPFTQHFLKLQGGRWDQPDRLFSSITEAWKSSSEGSTGVVMELIPEFYYLDEFLVNNNKFNFGSKQGGEAIDDIILPPWAKGSPQEFIKLHRKALESDYVSEHLHEWIDLIFGYKQQGKAADDSLNVFYYLTYEGAVNIDAITDPVEKAATIAQINNFGQTPKQLFDKPHPKRTTTLMGLPFYAKQSIVGNFIKDIGEPVGQIRLINDRATCVGFNKVLLPPAHSKYMLWGLPDGSIRYHTGDKIKVLEDHHDGPLTCLTATEDGRICVSGGSDSLICVYNLKRFSLAKRLSGHTGSITSIAASRPYSIIVSGSDDRTCIIWDLNRLCYVRSLDGHDGPISCIGIHDTTGEIVVCSNTTISVYTVNGEQLINHKTSQIANDQITCCIWSKGPEWLGENVLLTGHRDGKIKVWGLETRLLNEGSTSGKLKFKNVIILRATFYNQNSHSTAITSIFLTNDQSKFYTGDITGRICMWSDSEASQVKQRGWINTDTVRGLIK